jgi:6-pyruvoyl-tetrahydropterin synthase
MNKETMVINWSKVKSAYTNKVKSHFEYDDLYLNYIENFRGTPPTLDEIKQAVVEAYDQEYSLDKANKFRMLKTALLLADNYTSSTIKETSRALANDMNHPSLMYNLGVAKEVINRVERNEKEASENDLAFYDRYNKALDCLMYMQKTRS